MNTNFIKYYETNILPLKKQQEQMKADQAAKENAEREGMAQEFQNRAPGYVQTPADIPMQGYSIKPEQAKAIPIPAKPENGIGDQMPSILPQEYSEEDNIPIDLKNPEKRPRSTEKSKKVPPMNLRDRPILSSFISTLEKFASENNPEQMISAILKQSAELEDINVEQSMQLLSIAEGMIEDKTAGILDFWKNKEKASEDAPGLPLRRKTK